MQKLCERVLVGTIRTGEPFGLKTAQLADAVVHRYLAKHI
jgi:hypothetical protein